MTTATEGLMFSTAKVEIQAAGKTPAVTIVAYTGGVMAVPGWGPVAIELAGIDAAGQVGILADHDSTLKGIVGYGQARIENSRLIVAGTIAPTTEAARQIIDLARAGFQFQASVGVSPTDYERVRAGDSIVANGRTITAPSTGMIYVRAGELREVSIVSIAADRNTSVAITASEKGKRQMSTETIGETAEQIREEAAAESERINDIREACAGRFSRIEAKAIREGWDIEQTRLEVLRASRPMPLPPCSVDAALEREVLEAAILSHMGCEGLAEKSLGPHTAQRARDLRATSLIDLCRMALRIEGNEPPSERVGLIRAALSTYSLPVALGNAANKVLLDAYTESPATWRAFAAIKSANDFKEHTGVRPTQTGELEQVAPSGELKYGSLKESTYKYQIDTFGKNIGIDRRDIINDDLGAITTVPRKLGRGSGLKINDIFWKTFLDNAEFFKADNSNYLAGADTVLTIDGLTKAEVAFMDLTDSDGKPIGIMPSIVLVPTALSAIGTQLYKSMELRDTNSNLKYPVANPHQGKFRVEVSRYLSNSQYTGNSSKAWYLLADPGDLPVIEVAFLNGQESPTIETAEADFSVLGVQLRGYHDVGVSKQETRAGVKSKGEV